jgi:hypothetical protein
MKLVKAIWILLTVMLLASCGGGGDAGDSPFGNGGGGGGGGTTDEPSLSITLQDNAGAVLSPPALTGSQNAVVVVRLLDADGNGVPNSLVAVSGSGVIFTPATGQTITDATGTARVQVSAEDPFASGATTISAAGSVDGTAVQATIDVALGAATAELGAMTVSATSVPAYQTIQVSVPATVSGQAAVQVPVSFSASCGTFDPPTATTDTAGVARTAYRNESAGNVPCSGSQILTATAGTSTADATITAVAPTAANLVFVSATPARIYLAGSPGVSQSLLQFKLVDSNNNPVQGENVELTLTLRPVGVYLGATAGTTTLVQPTNSDGTVDVAVNAGTEPGPVQVQATLVSNRAIKNVSNALAVASGLPVQRAFSLSVSTFNIEALNKDGVTTDITLRIADRLGNPVPDGTTVNFVAEGGQVVASCNTTGAATNNTSACTVQLASQNPRPTNGRITILAWAQGEENFTDAGTPTNNVYDTGEAFNDLGQAFLDKDEDGIYDVGSDVTVGTPPGSAACPVGSQSVPGSCDGQWGRALVRASAVITFSGSDPVLVNTSGPAASGGGRCSYNFTMRDVNGNPMPAGTLLSITGIEGGNSDPNATATFSGFGGEGATVPNTSQPGGTIHSAVFTKCDVPGSLSFALRVSTPGGKITTIFLP